MIGSRMVRSDCGMNFNGAAAAPRAMAGAAKAAPSPAANVRRLIMKVSSHCHGPVHPGQLIKHSAARIPLWWFGGPNVTMTCSRRHGPSSRHRTVPSAFIFLYPRASALSFLEDVHYRRNLGLTRKGINRGCSPMVSVRHQTPHGISDDVLLL